MQIGICKTSVLYRHIKNCRLSARKTILILYVIQITHVTEFSHFKIYAVQKLITKQLNVN